MNFTEFKNRAWRGYSWAVRQLMKLPDPVSRAVYLGTMRAALWAIWLVPGTSGRRAIASLSRISGRSPPGRIFRGYARGLTATLYEFEHLRQGRTDEIGARLRIPEQARLDALLSSGGIILMMPHAHGSILMAEALGQRHPLLLLGRAPRDDGRASFQREYYDRMTCAVLDVRRADDMAVSKTVLSALRNGQIVLGAGDLIRKAPKVPEDKQRDLVRVEAFGQPVGAMRWPVRFAAKVGVPIVPVMIVRDGQDLTLHLGQVLEAGEIVSTTQAWMDGLVDLVCRHPADWTFLLDGKWMRVLEAADGSVRERIGTRGD